MSKNQKKVAEVKKVAKAEKRDALITEAEVKQITVNNPFVEVARQFTKNEWDGRPLVEDKVYHMKNLGGLKIGFIKDNRRTVKRILKMLKACMMNGMTTPAILVLARLVYEWGLAVIDPITGREFLPEELDGVYCVMEGHGRFDAWIYSAAYALKNGGEPFDYHFVYKHYDTPEDFGKAYVSTNADMTRTTTKDRLGIACTRCKNPIVISYLGKIKNDHVISKASYFWTVGRELNTTEVSKLIYGEEDAPQFNQDVTDALTLCYESFKEKFGEEGAETIYRGVATAQWCADQIGKAEDKTATAMRIAEKVTAMSNSIYTKIVTAKTNKKKHITRDLVIKTALDQMMTV